MSVELFLVGSLLMVVGIERLGENSRFGRMVTEKIGDSGYRLFWLVIGFIVVLLSVLLY